MTQKVAAMSKTSATGPQSPALIADDPSATEAEDRGQQIALRAYLKAADRGFEPGHEMEDWLEAEQEIDAGADDAHPRHAHRAQREQRPQRAQRTSGAPRARRASA